MASRNIFLDGGLRSCDPALQGEGDLSKAVGIEYNPGQRSPDKMKGHTAVEAAVVASSADRPSIAQARFDNAKSLLLMWHYVGPSAAPTTKGEYLYLEGRPSGVVYNFNGAQADFAIDHLVDYVDHISFNNEVYALFGGQTIGGSDPRNLVIGADGAARLLGMRASTEAPTVDTVNGAGAGFTLGNGKTITYWVEERVKDGNTVLRRNSGLTTTTHILVGAGSPAVKPRITRPTQVNSDATHWALFATGTNVAYGVGFEVAEVPIATTYIDDTRTGTNPDAPTGTAFATLTATVNGISLSVPRYGPAPSGAVGARFEDSLVQPDSTYGDMLRYSLIEDFDHYPAFNALRLGAREGEKITMMHRLGQSLVVGLSSSTWRVIALPRPEDAGFNTERAKERLESGFGAIGQKCSATFNFLDDQLWLAYVSSVGIHVTDGLSVRTISTNIKWENTVATDQLAGAFLVNNAAKYRLEFYHAPAGEGPRYINLSGSHPRSIPALPTKVYFLHYHPSQMRSDGTPKITGPHSVAATAGASTLIGTARKLYLATQNASNNNNLVVKADIGNSFLLGDATAADIAVDVASGEIAPAGTSGESVLGSIGFHHSAGAEGQLASLSVTTRAEERNDDVRDYEVEIERAGNSTASVLASSVGESFILGVKNSDSLGPFNIGFIIADFGEPVPAGGDFSKPTH